MLMKKDFFRKNIRSIPFFTEQIGEFFLGGEIGRQKTEDDTGRKTEDERVKSKGKSAGNI